jgi:TM2 domain-containing membrane protein YozV
MGMNYFFANGNVQSGPFPMHELIGKGLKRDSLVWREGMGEWQRADTLAELGELFAGGGFGPPPQAQPVGGYQQGFGQAPPPQGPMGYQSPGQFDKSRANSQKIAAGILGLILGEFGIHKFILGMTGPGLVMLLITVCSCGFAVPVIWVIGIIEGIIYLTKTDEEFWQTYMVEKKGWF